MLVVVVFHVKSVSQSMYYGLNSSSWVTSRSRKYYDYDYDYDYGFDYDYDYDYVVSSLVAQRS